MDALFDHIARFTTLTPDEQREVRGALEGRTIAARDVLVEPGRVPVELFFVERGILRLFDVDEHGRERTLQFALPNWWIADLEGFFGEKTSTFALQAVDESSVLALRKEHYEQLLARVPPLERYFRRVYERSATAALRRIHLMASKSGATLYADFRCAHPDFVERVPQTMLASFLGFTPEHLSRIRARLVRS